MIQAVADRLAAVAAFARHPAPDVLLPFHIVRSPVVSLGRKVILVTLCCLVGILYGFVMTVFPPFLLVYAAIPVLILILLVIWAMPDRGSAPTVALEKLVWLYLGVILLWPVYLSFSIPGLPWFSFRRILSFPMGLLLLICVSTSASFRRDLGQSLQALPALWKMVLGYTLIQFTSIFLSARPFGSINTFFNSLFSLIVVFFVSAWLFTKPKRVDRLVLLLIGTAVFLCLMGLIENFRQEILWANHIPFFFKIEDESVSMMLQSNFRDGSYRVTTVFSVSLAFAECLALITPFVLSRIEPAKGLFAKLMVVALDLLLLVVIVLTGARLGIVGFIVSHVYFGCIWAYRRWRTNRTDMLAPALALAFPIGAAAFGYGMLFVDAIKFRTIGGGSTGFSDEARQVQWAMAKPLIMRNPLGYGVGQGGEKLGFASPSGQLTVDSYAIAVLMDTGIVGLILFFSILIYPAIMSTKLWLSRRDGEIDYALPVATSLIAFVVIKLVLAQEDNHSLVFMILGVACAIHYRARHAPIPT